MKNIIKEAKACNACAFWHGVGENRGECRRHAPQTVVFEVDEKVKFQSKFPETRGEDWCGDFSLKG